MKRKEPQVRLLHACEEINLISSIWPAVPVRTVHLNAPLFSVVSDLTREEIWELRAEGAVASEFPMFSFFGGWCGQRQCTLSLLCSDSISWATPLGTHICQPWILPTPNLDFALTFRVDRISHLCNSSPMIRFCHLLGNRVDEPSRGVVARLRCAGHMEPHKTRQHRIYPITMAYETGLCLAFLSLSLTSSQK